MHEVNKHMSHSVDSAVNPANVPASSEVMLLLYSVLGVQTCVCEEACAGGQEVCTG